MSSLRSWLLAIFIATVFFICLAAVTKADAQEENEACFVVTAYNTFGESEESEEVCSEPFPFVITSKVVLEWNASVNATGYKIYYKMKGQTEWVNPGGKDVGDVLTATITACEIFCTQPPTDITVMPQ